jgi:hypothetical protein
MNLFRGKRVSDASLSRSEILFCVSNQNEYDCVIVPLARDDDKE